MPQSGRCSVCGSVPVLVESPDGFRCPRDNRGNQGHVVGTLGFDVSGVPRRPRIALDRRFEVLGACGFLCVFCRLTLRTNGAVPNSGFPTADTVFSRPSKVPVTVREVEERLAFQDDVDTLFPFDAHADIRKNCEARRSAVVSIGLDDLWLVAACGKCRAGRRYAWDEPATLLAIYAMHLYKDTDVGHADLEAFSAALRAYRHARAIRPAKITSEAV
jgi:hypothetical protein